MVSSLNARPSYLDKRHDTRMNVTKFDFCVFVTFLMSTENVTKTKNFILVTTTCRGERDGNGKRERNARAECLKGEDFA
jgi:hypothetical protein